MRMNADVSESDCPTYGVSEVLLKSMLSSTEDSNEVKNLSIALDSVYTCVNRTSTSQSDKCGEILRF